MEAIVTPPLHHRYTVTRPLHLQVIKENPNLFSQSGMNINPSGALCIFCADPKDLVAAAPAAACVPCEAPAEAKPQLPTEPPPPPPPPPADPVPSAAAETETAAEKAGEETRLQAEVKKLKLKYVTFDTSGDEWQLRTKSPLEFSGSSSNFVNQSKSEAVMRELTSTFVKINQMRAERGKQPLRIFVEGHTSQPDEPDNLRRSRSRAAKCFLIVAKHLAQLDPSVRTQADLEGLLAWEGFGHRRLGQAATSFSLLQPGAPKPEQSEAQRQLADAKHPRENFVPSSWWSGVETAVASARA